MIKKNEWLAVKVMGWKDNSYGDYWDIENNQESAMISSGNWNPQENIEQAMRLLDTFEYGSIFKDRKLYRCFVGNCNDGYQDESVSIAITEAVLKASGYYNEGLR